MAGTYDMSKSRTDFMSPFKLYRTVAASDADLSFTATLDLSKSTSAANNTLHILVRQTVGAPARVKIEAHAKLPDGTAPGGLSGVWFLLDKTGLIAPLELIRLSGLIAGVYKLKVILETTGTFDIYVSSSHNEF